MKICDYCQTPIEGDDYDLSPQGEPVHTGECHRAAWDAPTTEEPVATDGGLDMPDPDRFLDEHEVAANFTDYIDALEAEIAMSRRVIEGLEAGEIKSADLLTVLPDPSPLEAWQADKWDELGEDYDPMELKPDDGTGDGGEA